MWTNVHLELIIALPKQSVQTQMEVLIVLVKLVILGVVILVKVNYHQIFFFLFYFLAFPFQIKSKRISDVNECEIGDGPCSLSENCTNVIGSYLCSCQEGFEGDSCSGLFIYFTLLYFDAISISFF